MKQQTKTHPTLDALRRAIQTTDGSDATAFFLFATQDGTMGCSAFIGDGDRLAGALLALLNRVGEGRAMPQEMAMTRAVLMAVAAADVRNHGQLLDVIRQHRDAILAAPSGSQTAMARICCKRLTTTFRLSESRTMLASVMPSVRKVKTAIAGLTKQTERQWTHR